MTPPVNDLDGRFFTSADQAVAALIELYDAATGDLVAAYERACQQVRAGAESVTPVRRCYPELRFSVSHLGEVDPSLSHGFVDRAGTYATAIARPRLFRQYLVDQVADVLRNHGGQVQVRLSRTPIPARFAPGFDELDTSGLEQSQLAMVDRAFTPVDSAYVDDAIADGDADFLGLSVKPLSLFSAPRVDLALHRLEHYTGSSAARIQRFVLFTNYQLHTDVFLDYAHSLGKAAGEVNCGDERQEAVLSDADSAAANPHGYTHLVTPGDHVHEIGSVPSARECRSEADSCQMPAYHLVRPDGLGVTVIDIGVGPSNAKTITDCLAVLRPHCWMMVGHCAGLDGRMRIGDMILANGYDRADGVLDGHVPLEKPIPPIAEVQQAVTNAFREVSGLSGEQLKKRLRTGTVLSTSDRNWEWRPQEDIYRELRKSTAIGVEMESSTIAANGYRFRVPYGALLSVSDMPLHDKPKLPRSARRFYQASKVEHLMTAVRACEAMAADPDQLHSRKLRRPVGEVAFR
ncbi:AMP nucleosidase [Corynebacterium sp. TAE3-ERU12]|uniref:AMP nucleosidase n=1 Tax=Corynebacterium sp. TAE3-ERU12 TaxID=2849491 RepID=UPI001C444309|nr:AMP nucleosidase [Corynebacterium sp. TAE3-ERU12]MBV7294433.1 AMP nucleosidase [Corynebacterium sp. TAE3-ERU12]